LIVSKHKHHGVVKLQRINTAVFRGGYQAWHRSKSSVDLVGGIVIGMEGQEPKPVVLTVDNGPKTPR
jgi:hypothetical protein